MARPLSWSKKCRLAVSTLSSIGLPAVILLRALTRAVHRDFPSASAIAESSASAPPVKAAVSLCWTGGGADREDHVDLGAEWLGDVGDRGHPRPARICQAGVLKIGRPDAKDH